MKHIFQILVEELAVLRLEIKPGNIEIVGNSGFLESKVMHWAAGGVDHCVTVKDTMNILGVAVNEDGSDIRAIDHRICQAWIHFMARRGVFLNQQIPLKLRWNRIRETI